MYNYVSVYVCVCIYIYIYTHVSNNATNDTTHNNNTTRRGADAGEWRGGVCRNGGTIRLETLIELKFLTIRAFRAQISQFEFQLFVPGPP